MRKRVAIAGCTSDGLALIPLLEANPEIDVCAIYSPELEAARAELERLAPRQAAGLKRLLTDDMRALLGTPGLVALVDAGLAASQRAILTEAPGRGYHWGMATPHANLPRGTRIRVGIAGPLEQILFGPAFTEDGTLNLVGAIRTCMGSVGARTIRELQLTELIIAPTIKTEGKVFQQAQKLGRPR